MGETEHGLEQDGAWRRCKKCSGLWIKWNDGTWSNVTPGLMGPCCDNEPMGDQLIEIVIVGRRQHQLLIAHNEQMRARVVELERVAEAARMVLLNGAKFGLMRELEDALRSAGYGVKP